MLWRWVRYRVQENGTVIGLLGQRECAPVQVELWPQAQTNLKMDHRLYREYFAVGDTYKGQDMVVKKIAEVTGPLMWQQMEEQDVPTKQADKPSTTAKEPP